MKTLHEKLSGLFLWGFEGPLVSSPLRELFCNCPPAGVILFRRNLESRTQIKSLTREIRKAAGARKIFIGIDEEGGRVSRLRDFFPEFPPAAVYGQRYLKTHNLKAIQEAGRKLGQRLASLGFNTDFAPVLDVHSNPENPVIGDRAFSSDPRIAAKASVAFYEGLKSAGIVACGKHFPGHGDTATDSHLVLPHVDRSRRDMERIELVPFRAAIQRKIPMIMTAHVVYKSLDPENPATFSKKILTGLLRKTLKYRGLIVSDDLQMKAVSAGHSPAESALLSLVAGVDLILICREGERGTAVVEDVLRAVESSRVLRRRVEESCARVSALARML